MAQEKVLTVGSLFSGIGGIEIGFKEAGFTTKWFIEKELYPKEIIKKRFPKAKIYEDITKVDFTAIPEVDILTGGFPCQDISNAGKRIGIEGNRSSLWKYYLEAISTLRPRYAFIENVAALLNRGLDVVLCDLAKIGYDAEWHCVPASAVGAYHQRDRIFIIAYPNSLRCNSGRNNRETRQIQKNKKWDSSQDQQEWKRWQSRISKDGKDISNSTSLRSQKQRFSSTKKKKNTLSCGSCQENKDRFTNQNGYWSTEPKLGRMADGVPNRVDRIKCLGNAVVPQVAEVFAKAIKKGEE